MQIYRKASFRAGGASHPSRTFGESLEVVISPSRLDADSRNFYDISLTILPEIYRQTLFVRRPVFSLVRLVRPWTYRAARAAGKSFGAHICPIPCSLCHLMPSHAHPYPHGPPTNITTHSQHQSTARIRIPCGPFGLAEQGLLLEHFFLFQNFQGGSKRLESVRFLKPISSHCWCGYHKILPVHRSIPLQAFQAVQRELRHDLRILDRRPS